MNGRIYHKSKEVDKINAGIWNYSINCNHKPVESMIMTDILVCSLQEVKGSVKGLFEEKGIVVTEKTCSLEVALDAAITLGAEDVEEEDDGLVVSTFFN